MENDDIKFTTAIIIREDLNDPDLQEILMNEAENQKLALTLFICLCFLAFNLIV
jgi:hypothetical protein